MTKLIKYCLAAALAFGSAQASAGYIDLSQVQDVSAVLEEASSYDFGHRIVTTAAPGAANNGFSDRYTFALTTSYQTNALMTSTLYSDNTGLVITGFNLRTGAGALVFAGSVNPLFDAADQAWEFAGDRALTSGSYYLEVTGYTTAADASYSGTLAINAVPEPTSLALMLGGLAVLGVAMRRRA
ncbi:FxDxF family PEP-CTERM protein [Pseudoduganella armeniaca]|uniref:Ice-binding protein C-terminal domain-containing protein n=1 Tax=Pseudoduganella armeniaca TaxID=2072590 RepID=A0A2R4C8X0_9BURK|nr:FxDxF family PEP-CTERM protein [Pseudoduganella armeniaca]AVR95992.1 hypothetical protein C9I28_09795 [Pseudoduganella armeniaca]